MNESENVLEKDKQAENAEAECTEEMPCEESGEKCKETGDKATTPEQPLSNGIMQKLESMEASAVKTAAEMRELHKLYHNEFSNRLKKMQDELDEFHEIGKGRVFDGILAEIAKLYSDNEKLTETIESKQLKYMFMDLLQLLEANGVQMQKSNAGDKRHPRYCQIAEQITTHDPALHDTVAKSLSTGFYVENRALVKERIHVNVFKEPETASE